MAGDLRLLQHEGELLEPFEAEQIGSSAMAYKRNPMRAERIAGLARFVISLQANGAQTAATQWLERTLDDSANRRLTLPEAFLATDAILILADNIAAGLEVREDVIRRHVAEQMPFMATERWLMLGVGRGRRPPDAARGDPAPQPGRGRGGRAGARPTTCSSGWPRDPAFAAVPAAALRAELDPASVHRPRVAAGGRVPRRSTCDPLLRARAASRGRAEAAEVRRMTVLAESALPLPLLRRGKVREVYEVDDERLLLVASDRVSAFDVVMREPIPSKGAVLTQLSAFWFERLAPVVPSHFLTARTRRDPRPAPGARGLSGPGRGPRDARAAGRCRSRSSAWYGAISPAPPGPNTGRREPWPAKPLPAGLVESARLEPPIFSPATKAETGHDENVHVRPRRQRSRAPT